MKQTICQVISDLIAYAEKSGLADARDRVYFENRLMEKLHVSALEGCRGAGGAPLGGDFDGRVRLRRGAGDHSRQRRDRGGICLIPS